MRILAVNWLDRHNPQAGGAEIHFFEIFKRIVGAGAAVTLVTSGWDGADREVTIDGIAVRRFGGRHTFALRGRRAVRHALRDGTFDVVVEDINKMPLFLPTLTDLPVYAIVPHLFGTTAFREAALPVASLVWLAERPIPWIYRQAAFHAISQSTRDDLIARGISKEQIHVILPGVDTVQFAPDPSTSRTDVPMFAYVGRLKRYKGVDVAIRALATLRQSGVAATLRVAGTGDDRPRLERLARESGVADAVQFLGFISEAAKVQLLREAWAVVFPSLKEGWGITNVEAAACGTPAVAANSPGLKESVRHGETGWLVPPGDHVGFADAMTRIVREEGLLSQLSKSARAFAATLTWESAAQQTYDHLKTVAGIRAAQFDAMT